MQSPKHLCQSCHCLIEGNENYCSICGQKKITKTASLLELTVEFFANIFTLDSKLLRTFSRLFFLPGQLTNEYLAGKRKLYFSPIRLFLFWMTITLLLLNYMIGQKMGENDDLNRNIEMHKQSLKDSIQKELYLVFPDSISQEKIATTLHRPLHPSEEKPKREISLGPTEINILSEDFLLLTNEEIFQKYKINNWTQRLFVGQLAKAAKNPNNFQFYMLGHLSWIILFSIPLLALLLKLLYIRQKRPYVEHLIYTLHLHTFIFAIGSFFLIYLNLQDHYSTTTFLYFSLFLIFLYFVISLQKVYRQSKAKTVLKISLFLLGYCFVISFAILIFVLLNFLIF